MTKCHRNVIYIISYNIRRTHKKNYSGSLGWYLRNPFFKLPSQRRKNRIKSLSLSFYYQVRLEIVFSIQDFNLKYCILYLEAFFPLIFHETEKKKRRFLQLFYPPHHSESSSNDLPDGCGHNFSLTDNFSKTIRRVEKLFIYFLLLRCSLSVSKRDYYSLGNTKWKIVLYCAKG